jgi:hypothetical protein
LFPGVEGKVLLETVMNLSQVKDRRFQRRWEAAGAIETYVSAESRFIAMLRQDDPGLAVVRKINGQRVLDDPVAVGVIRAVAKSNCRRTFDLNADRVMYFQGRMGQCGRSPDDVVIVLINADDPNGGPLAERLMPGHDWQQYRDQGQVPFARGLAVRHYIEGFLQVFDEPAAKKLKEMAGKIAVVVVDYGVAEVFEVQPQ